MDWTTSVAVHESASPEAVRARIVAALRRGELDPALLYAGVRQATLWTALHTSVSPAKVDPAVAELYAQAFAGAASRCRGNVVHVVSLACGSGGKDRAAIGALRTAERAVIYTPVDLSLELVLTAASEAAASFRGLQCTPLLCELASCSVLPAILKQFDPSGAERLILFLGTIHNFWPPEILRSVLYPVRSQDQLLIGANLAPADSYDAALTDILRQYDNAPTRAWLWGALSELGLGDGDGELNIGLASSELIPGLKRIEARFEFKRETVVRAFEESISFEAGSCLRVFYSHRFTPAHLHQFLHEAGLTVTDEWVLPQEGLFLCQRTARQ